MSEAVEKLSDLRPFIEYLIATDEGEWQVGVVRNVRNTKNCLFGHLVNWYYGKDHTGDITSCWDVFEAMWACAEEVYPINDGKDPRYPQRTPKQRVVAFMKDLWLGITPPTWRSMELEYERYKQELES